MLAPALSRASDEDDRQAFVAAAETELADSDYQTTLPDFEPLEEEDTNFQFPPWLGGLLRILLWIIAGAIVLYILYHLIRFFEDRRLSRSPNDMTGERPVRVVKNPAGKGTLPTLDEAERLAADQNYSEAIHVLLLVALDALFKRLNAALPKAHTSREILTDERLRETWRKDLELLVGAVEEALFAGKAPGQKNYSACRSTYDNLAASLKEVR